MNSHTLLPVLAFLVALSSCTSAARAPAAPAPTTDSSPAPTKSPDLDCDDCREGSCSEAGALKMLNAILDETAGDKVTTAGKQALMSLNQDVVLKMQSRGFTCTTLAETTRNYDALLREMLSVRGSSDPVPGQVEAVRRRTFSLCPMWPFCG